MMSFPTFLACVWEVIQGFLKTGEGDENGNGGNRVHPLMHTQDDPQLCNESILDKHLLRSVQVGLGDLSSSIVALGLSAAHVVHPTMAYNLYPWHS